MFSISESIEGNFVKELCKSAKENNIYVVGTIYERSIIKSDNLEKSLKKRKITDNQFRVYDTVVFIDNKGKLISHYQKITSL